jgi:hypothetical protein
MYSSGITAQLTVEKETEFSGLYKEMWRANITSTQMRKEFNQYLVII